MSVPDVSPFAGKRVLVTGATGFIGGRVVELLGADPAVNVRALVHQLHKAPRIACYPVELMRGNIADAADVQRAVAGCDFIIHAAWDFGGRDGPEAARARNLNGLRLLLETAHVHPVERFVHISTAAVYDHTAPRVISEDATPGDPAGSYAQTKVEAEHLVRDYMARGLPAVILEPTIVYGPWSNTWTTTPLKRMRKADLVVDEGEGRCTPVYVDDLAAAILRACLSPVAVGQAFLIGGTESVGWCDFYGAYARMLGVPGVIRRAADATGDPSGGTPGSRTRLRDRARRIKRLVWLYRYLKFSVLGAPMPGLDAAEAPVPKARGRVMPSPDMLALYRCRATVSSAKARDLLGFVPAFDLARGMALTALWARWMKLLEPAQPGPDK